MGVCDQSKIGFSFAEPAATNRRDAHAHASTHLVVERLPKPCHHLVHPLNQSSELSRSVVDKHRQKRPLVRLVAQERVPRLQPKHKPALQVSK